MKDLGFNEFGEVAGQSNNDEESKLSGSQIELAKVSHDDDPDGEEEAENTEIAI
jgi:hypothetical protein